MCVLAIFIGQQYINQHRPYPCCSTSIRAESVPTCLERVITITNGVTRDMLAYRKRLIPYTPKFSLNVNNRLVKAGDTQEICITNNQLHVRYTYNFLHGYKTGTKTVTFELPEDMTTCNITFDWDQESRVMIKDAQLIAITA